MFNFCLRGISARRRAHTKEGSARAGERANAKQNWQTMSLRTKWRKRERVELRRPHFHSQPKHNNRPVSCRVLPSFVISSLPSHSHLLIAQAAHELTIFGRAREGGGGEVAVAAAAAQSNLLFVRSHDEPDLRAPRHMKSSSLPPPPTWRPAGWRRRRRRCKVKSSWFLGWMVLGCTRLHVEKSKELALPPPHPRSSIGVLISVGSMPIP